MQEIIAHINAEGNDRIELLISHLELSAKFASKAGADFGASTLACLVARLHDLGKSSVQFQNYIRSSAGDCEETDTDNKGSIKRKRGPDHSSAGAQFIADKIPGLGLLLAYAIAGHHAGLPDGIGASEATLAARLRKDIPEWLSSASAHLGEKWFDCDLSQLANEIAPFLVDGYSCAFFIRMLFSCLVDADYLATETFMNQYQAVIRQQECVKHADLEKQLEAHYEKMAHRVCRDGHNNLAVNIIRNEVKEDCLNKAPEMPGLFTLTVPTGGGKTLASMAFALRHAVVHKCSRIIYVIPYTSIIEQTAGVFRNVFGDDNVLEHHCNVDFGADNSRLKLFSENWDAPIVVTTSVQFFESLHANKPSRCRKLHNLANSVIILDEAQTLPIELLHPCLRALDELVMRYRATVVLCTATQPAVSHDRLKEWGLRGNSYGIREIVCAKRNLHDRLKRVCVERITGKITDDSLIEMMDSFASVLVIVSTRKHARELYQKMVMQYPHDKIFHLSAQMCPAHRGVELASIRAYLKAGVSCKVVSTQLIEAGVDIDFPCVFREQAGADAIAQAAGRCNREGLLSSPGRVFIFESAEYALPGGFLRTAAQKGSEIMSLPQYAEDLLAPEVINHYFESLYYNQSAMMDKYEVLTRLLPTARPREKDDFLLFCFKTLGQRFKLIDDLSVSLLIPYGQEGQRLCEELRKTFATGEQRAIVRKLQRYAVGIYGHEPRNREGKLIAEHLHGSYWILTSPELHYSDAFGVTFEGIDKFLDI